MTDGSYQFDETPFCGYEETVTISNLPSFVIHNENSSDFTINSTNDLDLIGEYPVTIRSEICVPDDYTGATCTPMVVEYEFKVVIQPCIVNPYSDTKRVGDITYNIGAAALVNIGNYIFDEDPVCNYPETVILTDLPAFITHNEDSSDFTLP